MILANSPHENTSFSGMILPHMDTPGTAVVSSSAQVVPLSSLKNMQADLLTIEKYSPCQVDSHSPTPLPTITHLSDLTWKASNIVCEQGLKQALKNGLKEGYRHVDCADLYYGFPEEWIGQVLHEATTEFFVKREDMFITCMLRTELIDPSIPNHDTRSPGKKKQTDRISFKSHVRKQCLDTLSRLQVDYIDLYLVQYGQLSESDFEHLWSAMETLVDEGLVKSIGVRNVNMIDILSILSYARIKPCIVGDAL